jgi:hypothetical protein
MSVIEGDLGTVALQKVLENIAAMRGSGILTVQGEDDIVAISFLEGGIVAADALNQTLEEGLGNALQSRNLVSEEDFVAVAREHSGGASESLGELLVRRGLVSRDEYLDAFRHQTFQLMVQVLDWNRGEFKFYGGDEVSYEEGFKPILIGELLRSSAGEAAVRPPPEVSAEPAAELDSVYEPAPPAPSVKPLDEAGAGRSEPVGLKLDEPRDQGLRAEIFLPPEPEAAPAFEDDDEVEEIPRAPAAEVSWAPWTGAALASVLAAAVVFGAFTRPGAALLPFPWQDNHRNALERQLRHSLLQKIDRAAKTYFLVEAHYPDSLADLVELGLLSEDDLRDASGAALVYSTDDVGYRIELPDSQLEDESLGTSESITGDFLLDPQWLSSGSKDEEPLFLLD